MKNNKTGAGLKTIGILIMVFGIIIGGVAAVALSSSQTIILSFVVGFVSILLSLMFGMLIGGFGELLCLEQQRNDIINDLSNKISNQSDDYIDADDLVWQANK